MNERLTSSYLAPARRHRYRQLHQRPLIVALLLFITGCINGTDSDSSDDAPDTVTVVEPAGSISGQVLDAHPFSFGASVSNATVTLVHDGTDLPVDADGKFYVDLNSPLPIEEAHLAVSISADGYRPREVNVALNADNFIEISPRNFFKYYPPVALDDGIAVGDPTSKGMDQTLVDTLMRKVVRESLGLGYKELHSLLVYKDGTLVVEEYNIGNDDFIRFEDNIARDSSRPAKQWGRTDKHYIASVNKALTATLAGAAMNAYAIDANDSIATLLPEYASFFSDPNKAAVTIHHLLSMQSGFTWDEWGSNDLALLWQSSDFSEFLLSRANNGPMSAWVYNSAGPNMLLRGLDNTVTGGIRAWAGTNFYEPLGITDYEWVSQPDGFPEGSARMHMRPRDLLKIGVMLLDGGVWNGQQVVPEAWVNEITSLKVNSPAGDYGYLFWLRELNGVPYISAEGDGGQYINVFPTLDMVIVMTQGNYLEWPLYVNQADEIMGTYLIPAAQ